MSSLYLSELDLLIDEVNDNKKSIWKSYSLALFLGWLGVHWKYLNNDKMFKIKLSFSILGIVSTAILAFISVEKYIMNYAIISFLSIASIWNLWDLISISQYIDKSNKEYELEMRKEILSKRNGEYGEK